MGASCLRIVRFSSPVDNGFATRATPGNYRVAPSPEKRGQLKMWVPHCFEKDVAPVLPPRLLCTLRISQEDPMPKLGDSRRAKCCNGAGMLKL